MQWLGLFFSNFGLVMFVVAAISILIHKKIAGRHLLDAEIVFRWMTLLPLGVVGIYTFIMHAFFPEITSRSIGWAPSPFEYEVAVADLAIGVLGCLAFKASYGFRLATVIAATIWLWGDAIGHIMQMVKFHNLTVGNAGSWFWMDIVVPLILIVSLAQLRPGKLL